MPGRIVIGTSSWADPGFVQEWYPPGLPARDRLPFYAERFEGVEVNSTFYAIPAPATVRRWVAATPAGFSFDVKLHRLLSRHAAELGALPAALRERAETTPRGRVILTGALEAAMADAALEAVAPLAEAGRLSTFLLQLSPSFEPGAHALAELEALVARLAAAPVAIEFRHRGWLEGGRLEDTLGWLEDHGAALVCVDGPRDGRNPTVIPMVDAVTRPAVAYLRAHGRDLQAYAHGRSVAERFAYRYGDDELRELGERALGLAEQADDVRLMLNNNRGDDAPAAARRLRELLGQVPEGAHA
jgi:uncharacterized protein YecE (DUF72 family)